jgi:hypothetical protein
MVHLANLDERKPSELNKVQAKQRKPLGTSDKMHWVQG